MKNTPLRYLLFLIVLLIPGLLFTSRDLVPTAEFIISMVTIAGFLLVCGKVINGVWLGVFVDERNKISLSRMQLVVWVSIILSGYFTMVIYRLTFKIESPLAVNVPEQLWYLMGISTASLIGSPLIKSIKEGKTGSDSPEVARVKQDSFQHGIISQRTLGETGVSTIVTNAVPELSSAIDIFRGEELANYDKVDVGKVQMFLFTLIIMIVYITAMISLLNSGKFDSLPVVDSSMVALLGISHAGYLTNKAVPK